MKTIGNTREYFDEIVEYNLQQYKAQPTCLAAAFNLANALFHLHEWFWHDYENELKIMFGENVKSEKKFSGAVQDKCNAFKNIRDLANASKHVTLTQKPSTNAKHITDTYANEDDYVEDDYVEDDYVEGKGVYINDGGNNVDFGDCADEVYEYWSSLIIALEI